MTASASTGEQDFRHVVRSIGGREIVFDEEGFFRDFDQWSEAVFEILAGESSLDQLTANHLKVIRFLREFYGYNGRAPLNNELRKGTGLPLKDLEALFPQGIKKGARRLAGLPNPKTCE
jgi:dissimilatory sulfite reductase related protein